MNIYEKSKSWLITGITGQDGSYFADLLIEYGYTNIHGLIRSSTTENKMQNISHILSKITLHTGDITDYSCMSNIISNIKPDYIVNFAAQSHVKVSNELQNYTFQVDTVGVLNILQSVKNSGLEKTCRIYQASTSEMYGNKTNGKNLLNEESSMKPVSMYGIAKKASQDLCDMYKNAHGMFIVSSILFNHESPRRGKEFVTRKITEYVAKYNFCIKNNKTLPPLELGNLNARRDWGDARDYVKAIYYMLIHDVPKNFVIASGETHSVREFVELAFKEIGLEIKWSGVGVNELGIVNGNVSVKVNPKFYRDIEIDCLIGNYKLAKDELGWTPTQTFSGLVKDMVKSSIENFNKNNSINHELLF